MLNISFVDYNVGTYEEILELNELFLEIRLEIAREKREKETLGGF